MLVKHFTITGSHAGPHLLILAGVHGDEYEPIAAVRNLLQLLEPENLKGRVTVVPLANEPAFLNRSRTGPDNLDLARTMPGLQSGTVTEQIAFELAALIRTSDYLIDLHTGGLALKISPLAGYMLHQAEAIQLKQKQMALAFNLPIVWATSPFLEGRTLSVARDANIPAIYAEWGGGSECQQAGVKDYVVGCCNVMRELGMVDGDPPPNQVRYIVEDFRDDSGHLQRNYPAPEHGFFESAIQLNENVQSGSRLGWIYPLDRTRPVEVLSRHKGNVILLRTIPAVSKGDCLFTILEVQGEGVYRYER